MRYNWDHLSNLQLGKYAEYFVKMKFTLAGFDVYTSEVDDKGIDFIIRKNDDIYYDVQVKSVRGFNYIFISKDKFNLRRNLLAAIVIFLEIDSPKIYLIPSIKWYNANKLLVSRDYEGRKSKPEWGLNISKRNFNLLMEFEFDKVAETL